MSRYWLIRYSSPVGRTSLSIAGPQAVARDIADRLHEATLLETRDITETAALAAVLEVPAELDRIGEACK